MITLILVALGFVGVVMVMVGRCMAQRTTGGDFAIITNGHTDAQRRERLARH